LCTWSSRSGALWNFHFIVIPIAVLALQELPPWICWLFTFCFGIANLRLGAQLTPRWLAHAFLFASLAVGAVASARCFAAVGRCGKTCRCRQSREPSRGASAWRLPSRPSSSCYSLRASSTCRRIAAMRPHTASTSSASAVHFHGTRPGGARVVIVGGSAAFAAGTRWPDTLAGQLADALNNRLGWTAPTSPRAIVTISPSPASVLRRMGMTLHDFDYLHPDVVCIYDGYDAEVGDRLASTRRPVGPLSHAGISSQPPSTLAPRF